MVDATVARATAAPIQGKDREIRRDSRAPPHLATRWVIVMELRSARSVPDGEVTEEAEFTTKERRERRRTGGMTSGTESTGGHGDGGD